MPFPVGWSATGRLYFVRKQPATNLSNVPIVAMLTRGSLTAALRDLIEANSRTATVCAPTGGVSRAQASAAIIVSFELVATLARARIVLKLAHGV